MKTPAKTKSRKYKKQAAANSVVEEKEVAYKTKVSVRKAQVKKIKRPEKITPWVKSLMGLLSGSSLENVEEKRLKHLRRKYLRP